MEDAKPVPEKIELKLFIHKKEEKVVYAEANKEFVDFLFSLVSLPLGMVIKVLQNHGDLTLGSIVDLYNSIQSLNKTYLVQSSPNLDPVLNPKPSLLSFKTPLLLTNTDSCVKCPHRCPNCKSKMTSKVGILDKNGPSTSSGLGIVKDMVTFMVMDNLEVKPLSTISTMALLNSSNIHDLNSLQEIVVYVGAPEGLKLLEESLKSKNVLTSVFLAKRSKRKI